MKISYKVHLRTLFSLIPVAISLLPFTTICYGYEIQPTRSVPVPKQNSKEVINPALLTINNEQEEYQEFPEEHVKVASSELISSATNLSTSTIMHKPSVKTLKREEVSPQGQKNVTNDAKNKTSLSQSHAAHSSDPHGESLKKLNPDALLRAVYVLGFLTFLVFLYIIIMTIRTRRKKTHIHKYGVVASVEDLEMAPLDSGDEDDETHFDINHHTMK